jgi:hypothetical protein
MPDPRITALLFPMNAEFRYESRRIARARMETNGSRAQKAAATDGLLKRWFRASPAVPTEKKEAR